MKQLLFILTTILFISCSKEDNPYSWENVNIETDEYTILFNNPSSKWDVDNEYIYVTEVTIKHRNPTQTKYKDVYFLDEDTHNLYNYLLINYKFQPNYIYTLVIHPDTKEWYLLIKYRY